jgi:hypothetical protein
MSTPSGGPFNAKTDELKLEWSLQHTPSKELFVHIRMTSLASANLYLLDRLWRLDASSRIIIDPQVVYRYERTTAGSMSAVPPNRACALASSGSAGELGCDAELDIADPGTKGRASCA